MIGQSGEGDAGEHRVLIRSNVNLNAGFSMGGCISRSPREEDQNNTPQGCSGVVFYLDDILILHEDPQYCMDPEELNDAMQHSRNHGLIKADGGYTSAAEWAQTWGFRCTPGPSNSFALLPWLLRQYCDGSTVVRKTISKFKVQLKNSV